MLKRLLELRGADASHPDSATLMPAPNPTLNRDHEVIRVMEPWLGDEEQARLLATMRGGIISSAGPAVREFEVALARACGTEHAFALSCGTHALELALHCLEVGPGDEVIVPAFAFISVGAAVARRGARPVFVDVDAATLNLDASLLSAAITQRTRGLIAVHTYGQMCDMDAICHVADEHELFVLEDACEAMGCRLGGRAAGGLGDVAVHSFYANKMITTGNGGAITTDSDELAALVADLRGYSYAPERFFWHHHLPFNMRMSALSAAVGVAQLERLPDLVAARRALGRRYRERLSQIPGLILPVFARGSVPWMYTVQLEDTYADDVAGLRARLAARGVETRPAFAPLHVQPVLQRAAEPVQGPFPKAEWASQTGLNLPSDPRLTDAQLDLICEVVRS
ncbi:MAG: DegT/DnrJ/EryC1/StrS family aminotransferase [Deltaproteobacteria bacterium]|nr:DegT/DnrJ/EryC1/StrS family aminotransferase [Deltaproteobacteria bacterium]